MLDVWMPVSCKNCKLNRFNVLTKDKRMPGADKKNTKLHGLRVECYNCHTVLIELEGAPA